TPDYPTQRPGDVKTPLVTAPSASDAVASSAPEATPVATPIAAADDEDRGWTATRLGVLLMVLGLISLLSSSPALPGHRPARPGRAISRSEDKSAANRRTFSVWYEADQDPDNFHVTRRRSVIVGPCRHSPGSETFVHAATPKAVHKRLMSVASSRPASPPRN